MLFSMLLSLMNNLFILFLFLGRTWLCPLLVDFGSIESAKDQTWV